MSEDDILQEIERRSREGQDRLRALLHEKGRPDLVRDFDANMRDIRLGLTGARSTWHSISPAQRKVLETMKPGRWLRRSPGSRTRFDAVGGNEDAISNLCGIATVRNLTARELLACDGGAFDPEAKLVPTERAQFVLRHGPT